MPFVTDGPTARDILVITDGPNVRDILVHVDEPTAPPRIAPGRGPPPLLRRVPANDRLPGISVASSTVSSWPGAAVPEVCRKQTIKGSGGAAKGCDAAPAPTGGHRPGAAIRGDDPRVRPLKACP
jgi:hypothetical protein